MGLKDISPATRIIANDKDVTAAISDRFRSLRITDEVGIQSDTLEIVLADHDLLNPVRKPSKGAELEIFLGYDSHVSRMGLFVFDEFERSGWPGQVTIRARAAVYEGTPKGKKDIQTQKSRSWPKGTTIGAMVAKIAKEHGMDAAVAQSLASTQLPHLNQTEESDISFLLRALKTYGAVVKPAGGKLLVAKRGESKSIGGQDLPTVTIVPMDCGGGFTYRETSKESPGTVVAYWHSMKGAKRNSVTIGTGDPAKRLRHTYPTEDAAKAAANAELEKRERGQTTFSATMEGRADLVSEGRMFLEGFTDEMNGEWLLSRVEHVLDDSGYRCNVEAERPTEKERTEDDDE